MKCKRVNRRRAIVWPPGRMLCIVHAMIAKDVLGVQNLMKGQIWKLKNGFIQIGHQGKLLVEYKILRTPEQRRAPSSLVRPAELVNYLRKNEAQLVN